MIIKSHEQVPFGFAVVRYSPNHYMCFEVQPVPFHWIKRWYYRVLENSWNISEKENELIRSNYAAYEKGKKEGYDKAELDFKNLVEKLDKLVDIITKAQQ